MTTRARLPLVIGNWKMHLGREAGLALLARLAAEADWSGVEAVACPPAPLLAEAAARLAGSGLRLGAQNCGHGGEGAYTGELSAGLLAEYGCSHVLVGHSERRRLFREDDGLIARKLAQALAHGLRPVLCIGEDAGQRKAGLTAGVLAEQLEEACGGLGTAHWARLTLAYEPVWAIGAAGAAAPMAVAETLAALREDLAARFGLHGQAMPALLYGGSVDAANAAGLVAASGIDGLLVGRAALDAAAFGAICRAVARHADHSVVSNG